MLEVVLLRTEHNDQGTFGRLVCPETGLNIHIIELPDRKNEVGYSRIPEGDYIVKPYNSPKFGKCWRVHNVRDRSYILFHKGNLAGDIRKGFKSHSRGCLLPGWYKGHIGAQNAVLNSTKAFNEMILKIGLQNFFKLKIIDS